MIQHPVRPSILQTVDTAVSQLIAESRCIGMLDAYRMFLCSQTPQMLEDDDLKMWCFSPLALFDMWETELATGDPRDSLYLRGDEIG